MAKARFRLLWKNEYFQTLVTIVLVVVVVFGFWFGSQLVLRSEYPALAVASGSMCVLPGYQCDGWSHPFERTLHLGDLIIVQGVDASQIHAAPYPDGDIIVFKQSYSGGELIVHRAIEKQEADGQISFVTKGDGNSSPDSSRVPASNVVGRVVMRIPWIGHLALLMRNSSGMIVIIALIIVLVVLEFVIPIVSGKKRETEAQASTEDAPKT
jgi:signal peptidase